jgi:hypothetical protein
MSATCSSCGAEIVWMITTNGRPMPCDPKRLTVVVPTGKILATARGDAPEAEVKTAFISHWASCPNAAQHRKSA